MDMLSSFKLFISEGDTVLDIGAFDGSTALKMAELVGPNGKVLTFEANPKMFTKLDENTRSATNIFPIYGALAAQHGFVEIFHSQRPSSSQASTIIPTLANSGRFGEIIEKSNVRSVTLDSIHVQLTEKTSFWKIDVEGAEHLVFEGGKKFLQKDRPVIYFECGFDGDLSNYSHIPLLLSSDYSLFCADIAHIDGEWIQMDSPELSMQVSNFENESSFNKPCLMNFIAIPNERVEKYASRLILKSWDDFVDIAKSNLRFK